METLPSNPYLEFNPNQLAEVRKLFNYDDVNKIKQDLEIFENWILKQNHFTERNFDREYLERYLIANKGSVERAKKRFDKLLTLRTLLPEFMRNYDIMNEFEHINKVVYACVSPKPMKDNYRVVIAKVLDVPNEKAELLHFYRYMIVVIEYLLHHDYNAGYEYVLDAREINMGLMAKLNPVIIHKAMTIIEAYGLRLRALHFISGSSFFDSILSIIKQGLNEKIRKRIVIHTNIESLYEHIPKDVLPKDYGGDLKNLKELMDDSIKEVSNEEHKELMRKTEKIMTDETCRLASTFNQEYSGTPGSFKTLCVD